MDTEGAAGTRVLHVICTPRGLASNTGRVSSALLDAMRVEDEQLDVRTLDLFRADIPSVAGRNIETTYRLMTAQGPEEDARDRWQELDRAIEQFLAADVYLLTVPMWNLGIPYVLKYYIDTIVQPGYLFRYDEVGEVEPLVHGKKMIVVVSSGRDAAPESKRPCGFVEPYLRAIFGFVGVTDITFLCACGMDGSPDVRKRSQKAAIAAANQLARSASWRRAGLEPAPNSVRRPQSSIERRSPTAPATPGNASVPAATHHSNSS